MLVNTCAVRDNAEQRVIGRMGELQRHKRPGDVLGVVGLHGAAPGPGAARAGAAGGPRGRTRRLSQPARAHRRSPAQGQRATDTEFRPWEHYEDVPPVRENGPTAFVTVQRGCDYRCTFCIVPVHPRPGAEPRAWTTSCAKSEQLAAAGHHRGHAAGPDGQQLSRRPARLRRPAPRGRARSTGIRRLRFTSPYPTDFTPRVIEAMADNAGGVRARAPAGAERLERRAPAHAPALYPGALSRGGRRAPRGHARHHLLHRHHRRLPGRDRKPSSRKR